MQNNTTVNISQATNAIELEGALLKMARDMVSQWDALPASDFSDEIMGRFEDVAGLTEATSTPEAATALARVLWGSCCVPHEIEQEDMSARQALRGAQVAYLADTSRHPAHYLLLALVNAIHRDMEEGKK